MGSTKITITGIPEKEPKINSDKTVELLFKNTMTAGVPKGLKCLGDTFYLVRIAPKTWKKVSDKITKDSFCIIQGEPKAAVNKRGIPFITVVCFDISLKEDNKQLVKPKVVGEAATDIVEISNKPDELRHDIKPFEKASPDPQSVVKEELPAAAPIDNSKAQEKAKKVKQSKNVKQDPESAQGKTDQTDETNKTVKSTKQISDIPWFFGLEDQLIELNLDDVYVTENTHLKAYTVSVLGLNFAAQNGYVSSPIAVKQLEDGKYTLIAGFKPYIQAKILNFKKIRAFVTDLNHAEFLLKYKIEERRSEPKK